MGEWLKKKRTAVYALLGSDIHPLTMGLNSLSAFIALALSLAIINGNNPHVYEVLYIFESVPATFVWSVIVIGLSILLTVSEFLYLSRPTHFLAAGVAAVWAIAVTGWLMAGNVIFPIIGTWIVVAHIYVALASKFNSWYKI